MHRGYSLSEYRRTIERVRRLMPQAGITTDVIVGFPGETDEQFESTCELLEEMRYDKVHVAAYSPRPGTIAFRKLADDVPEPVKKARLQRVEAIQERIATMINTGLLGATVEVLVEGEKDGRPHGRTRSGQIVPIQGQGSTIEPGRLVQVDIDRATAWSLQGSLAG
jgi:tRNA-2-methylthio-N6-dimethylallyladenosine synthase